MTETPGPLTSTSVEVVVELNPELNAFAVSTQPEGKGPVFRTQLLKYLNGFLDDLAIPTSLSLFVNVADGKPALNATKFRIQIDKQNCRIPMSVVEPEEPVEFARLVAKIVSRNLELFVSEQLADNVLENWIIENEIVAQNRPPARGFHRLLRSLVQRGYNIQKGESVFKNSRGTLGVWDEARFFEEAIAGVESTKITVLLKPGVRDSILDPAEPALGDFCDAVQSKIFQQLGIALPRIGIGDSDDLEENEFRLQLNDVRHPPVAVLGPDQFLTDADTKKLAELKVAHTEYVVPETGAKRFVCEDKKGALEKCRDANLRVWTRAEFLAFTLEEELRRNAGSFLTLDAVKYGLDLLRDECPTLVDLASKRFAVTIVSQILRCLLDEEISIKNGRSIVESLVFIGGTTSVDHSEYLVFYPDPPSLCPVAAAKDLQDVTITELANRVRMSLNRYISYKYTGGNTLVCYTIALQNEKRIAQIDTRPFQEIEKVRLINAILDKTRSHGIPNSDAVIVTSILIRKKLRELIEKEFPRLAVLCYQELTPNLKIQHLADISWANV